MIGIEQLTQILDVLPYPVFVKNAQHQWIYGNAAFEELMGHADYIGKDDRAFCPPEQVKAFRTADRRVFAGEEVVKEEEIGSNLFALTRKVPLVLPDGSTGLVGIILASVRPNAHPSDGGTPDDTVSLASGDHLRQLNESLSKRTLELESSLTIAELKQQAAMEVAHTDTTTGLKNRLGFKDKLAATIREAEETGRRFGVAFIDVDRFKQINDRFGHAAGDLVLKTVGKRLCELPDVFAVARWGGDEFVLLTELPNIGQNALVQGFEEAHTYTFRPIKSDHGRIEISGSVGIAVYPQDTTYPDDLMRYADMALMVAKRQGRGKVLSFDAKINNALSRRMQITRDLPGAISNNEVRPFYQPIVCAKTRKIQGVEALARWTHKDLGPINPEEMFEIAHGCGLATQLDARLHEAACRDVGPWLNTGAIKYLSLNISPMDIVSIDFADRFLAELARTKTDPKTICLEIVESAFVDNLDTARRNLDRLHKAGVMIALDDYGTGFSNLRALLELPLDKLKIDKSLIQSIGSSYKIADLMTSIMQLAGTLDVKIVAEGIETKLQSAFVTSAGCDLMQGYMFSRPLSFDAMDRWLAVHQKRVA
ncbi:sensor domain-containing protein [Hyphomonas sp.]|uniref:sensor domain-containing protein n=1 Tax=Hyphomonas sp. TaxID=87 RepID=UPI003D2D6384